MQRLAALAAAGLATAWAGTAAAQAALGSCGSFPRDQDQLVCLCEAGRIGGSVWGSGPYTGDSDICTAAIHAGRLTPNGGAVQAFAAPAQDSYSGSTANGITSSDWGSYGYSFDFRPPLPVTAGGSQCDRLPDGASRHSCTCPPASGPGGSVWGSGPYTADSDLCTAARHAGLIGEAGGPVTAIALEGLEQYLGSEWHGVVTQSWGAYGRSFVFDANVP